MNSTKTLAQILFDCGVCMEKFRHFHFQHTPRLEVDFDQHSSSVLPKFYEHGRDIPDDIQELGTCEGLVKIMRDMQLNLILIAEFLNCRSDQSLKIVDCTYLPAYFNQLSDEKNKVLDGKIYQRMLYLVFDNVVVKKCNIGYTDYTPPAFAP